MVKPELKDYGLSESDEGKHKSKTKWIWVAAVPLSIVISLGALFLYYENKADISNLISTTLVVVFLAFCPFPFGVVITNYIIDGLFRAFDSKYSAYLRYEKDHKKWNKEWILTQQSFWLSLDGRSFERAVAILYKNLNYDAKVTDYTGDKGVDIWITKNNQRIPVQCKAHKNRISPGAARELYGTMKALGCNKGILVSRSGFTTGVYEFSATKPIVLVHMGDLINMQKQYMLIQNSGN